MQRFDALAVILEGKAHLQLLCVCSRMLSISSQVILKDLEVLAEIASSPAGQTEGYGPSEAAEPRPGQVELHVPIRNSQLSSSGMPCTALCG